MAALVFTSDVSERSPDQRSAIQDVLNSGVPCISLMQATALSLGPRYSSSLGGMRGGSSGVNDTPSPARGGVLNSPVDASPPDHQDLGCDLLSDGVEDAALLRPVRASTNLRPASRR